jgi:hypothetical protein
MPDKTPRVVLRSVAVAVLLGLIAFSLPLIARPRPATASANDQNATPAIGVNDYEVEGVEVALLSVKRISDGSLTVKWEYRNKTDEPKRLGESFPGMGSSEAYSLVWHAYLADARGKIKYPVAKDQRGNPVAAAHAAGKVVTLGPKKTTSTWAKFISVPADVKKISVFIPGTQPFEDVPISD